MAVYSPRICENSISSSPSQNSTKNSHFARAENPHLFPQRSAAYPPNVRAKTLMPPNTLAHSPAIVSARTEPMLSSSGK